jgi:hypothetical protein
LEILKPPEEPGHWLGSLFSAARNLRHDADIEASRRSRHAGLAPSKMPNEIATLPATVQVYARMPSGRDKWIRSVKHNPAGRVVSDTEGNRWEWDRADIDETGRLLQKLHNDELAIEHTDIAPVRRGISSEDRAARRDAPPKPLKKSSGRDAGGGFNPYDSTGKPRRR